MRALRRTVALLIVLVLAACGEDARQLAAEQAVRGYARRAEPSLAIRRTGCTRSARIEILRLVPTRLFSCIVQAKDGRCDSYRATLAHGQFAVRLRRRGGGCALPVS